MSHGISWWAYAVFVCRAIGSRLLNRRRSDDIPEHEVTTDKARARARMVFRASVPHPHSPSTPETKDPAPSACDVLVLDTHDSDRDALCGLLELLGFCPYPARSPSQALWLLETRPFPAVFLTTPVDGNDDEPALELYRRFKHWPLASGAAPALFVVSETPGNADRMLAALPECKAHLIKPLGRSDVVEALETSGLGLRLDEQRV